jgi:hypothetical protein
MQVTNKWTRFVAISKAYFLLRSIRTSEMEKEFEARVKYLEKVNRISEIPSHSKIAEQIEVENVKKILHEVLRRCKG